MQPHATRDLVGRWRVLAEAERMQHLVDERRLGVPRILTPSTLERSAAHVHNASPGDGDRKPAAVAVSGRCVAELNPGQVPWSVDAQSGQSVGEGASAVIVAFRMVPRWGATRLSLAHEWAVVARNATRRQVGAAPSARRR